MASSSYKGTENAKELGSNANGNKGKNDGNQEIESDSDKNGSGCSNAIRSLFREKCKGLRNVTLRSIFVSLAFTHPTGGRRYLYYV